MYYSTEIIHESDEIIHSVVRIRRRTPRDNPNRPTLTIYTGRSITDESSQYILHYILTAIMPIIRYDYVNGTHARHSNFAL